MKEANELDKPKKNKIKIIIVGSIGVGKTCLLSHYMTGKFLSDIPSSNGASFVQIGKEIKGQKYELNIWDTAGQEKYNSLTKAFITNSNIVILVYSIVDKFSFQSLNNWLQLVKEVIGEDGYALGVAANKADLYRNSVVSDSQGQEYARKINAIWKSTSAKMDDSGFKELIIDLLDAYLNIERNSSNPEYIKLNNKKKKKQGGCCQGKQDTKTNDNNNEKKFRESRFNSKMSTISIEENAKKYEDEDF